MADGHRARRASSRSTLGRAADLEVPRPGRPDEPRRSPCELEITEVGDDERGRYAIADASLWVDGKRIYAVRNLGMRIVAGAAPDDAPTTHDDEVLDPAVDTWLGDHRPTWTMPALPMMSMVDRLARAAARRTGRAVVALRDVQVHALVALPGRAGAAAHRGHRQRRRACSDAARLARGARSRGSRASSRSRAPACSSPPTRPRRPPSRPSTSTRPRRVDDPYASGTLFHGPPSSTSASCAGARAAPRPCSTRRSGSVPRALLHQGLLDAATHAIPHDELWRWSPEIPRDVVAYPYRIPRDPAARAAAGPASCGSRRASPGSTAIRASRRSTSRSSTESACWWRSASSRCCCPRGRSARPRRRSRRAFLRDRQYVPGVGLSRVDGDGDGARGGRAPRQRLAARQRGAHLRRSRLARCSAARRGRRPRPRRAAGLRAPVGAPRRRVGEEREGVFGARAAMRPLRLHRCAPSASGEVVRVVDAAPPVQDLEPVRTYWRERFGVGAWPVEDLYYGLVERFVGDVVHRGSGRVRRGAGPELPLPRQPPGGHRVAALQRARCRRCRGRPR